MAFKVSPGWFGAHHNPYGAWSIEVSNDALLLTLPKRTAVKFNLVNIRSLRIDAGQIWWRLSFTPSITEFPLSGLTEGEARKFGRRLNGSIAMCLAKEVEHLRLEMEELVSITQDLLSGERYISNLGFSSWKRKVDIESKGRLSRILDLLTRPQFDERLVSTDSRQSASHLCAILKPDGISRSRANDRFLNNELARLKPFFDTLEKSPLTDEQRVASVALDDRSLIVAAAGSGKTSTIIGKAAYLIESKNCAPEQILVLTFNKLAASEIRNRLDGITGKLGIPKGSIKAQTFHAFGRDVISKVSKRQAIVANFAVGGTGSSASNIDQIVEHLLSTNEAFRRDWLTFQTQFYVPEADPFDTTKFKSLSDWNSFCADMGGGASGGRWLPTLKGDIVKSNGELQIANWLFCNGVNYEYEPIYPLPTGIPGFEKYQPDFYLPDIDVYLEHFAINLRGEVPKIFEDVQPPKKKYSELIQNKRDLHSRNKTKLIETTWADLLKGELTDKLAALLRSHGKVPTPLPFQTILEHAKALNGSRAGSLIATFLKHFKSRNLDLRAVRAKIGNQPIPGRVKVFVRIFDAVFRQYQENLKKRNWIDFEDLLNGAAKYLEDDQCWHDYKAIIVDEFQDCPSSEQSGLFEAVANGGFGASGFAV